MDKNMQDAIDIVSKLIRKVKINDTHNKELYTAFANNTYISSNVEMLLESFQMDLYISDTYGIFVAPKPGNSIFGYKNAELKSELGVKTNNELYLIYFIIYNIISSFYIQSNYKTGIEYLTTKTLSDRVEERLKGLSDNCHLDASYEESFKNLYSLWNTLPLTSEKDKETVNFEEKRGKSKVSYINKTFTLLETHELIKKDIYTNRYSITSKFECMIEQFFDDSDTNNILIELLDEEIREAEETLINFNASDKNIIEDKGEYL